MQIIVDDYTRGEELYHLSILFQSLAGARGFTVPKPERAAASQTSTVGELSVTLNVDTSDATSAVEALADLIDRTGVKVEDVPPVTVSVDTAQAESNSEVEQERQATDIAVNNDNLDSAGLPWDARIHAGSRERNTDGSWRVRRRPKGVEEAEWEATLARVTSELRYLMEIPVSPGAVADAAAETALTDDEVDAFVDIVQDVTAVAPPVVVAPPVIAVAPPITVTHIESGTDTVTDLVVTPPTVEPPITTASPAIETFAQVMTWLTARTPKDEAAKPAMIAKVNEILAANGLTVLTQLGQRPDLIPQVVEQFKAAFGE